MNAHTEFGENPLTFTQVFIQKRKYGWMDLQETDRLTDGWTHRQPT